MNKLFYPSIFHIAEEGGFWVTFPDLPECMTQGDDMQNAYEMAVDALGLALISRKQEHQEIPVPSQPKDINVSKNEYCIIIEFDMLAYQKRNNSKAVKKTLTMKRLSHSILIFRRYCRTPLSKKLELSCNP